MRVEAKVSIYPSYFLLVIITFVCFSYAIICCSIMLFTIRSLVNVVLACLSVVYHLKLLLVVVIACFMLYLRNDIRDYRVI